MEELDDLFAEAVKVVCQYDKCSSSLIQRRLSIGYARAARIMDQLESKGVVSASDGSSKPRDVLVENAEEFLKNIPIVNVPPPSPVNLNAKDYKPKLASFLPKEFLELTTPTKFGLGYDENKKVMITDFSEIGNLLVIGSPISKKYEYIDSLIVSALSNFTPNKLRLIIYDSSNSLLKYQGLPHLLAPIITNWEKSISALRWCVAEADRRQKLKAENQDETLPEIYFIYNFDYGGVEIESSLTRLSSVGHKVGIHLIIFTDQLAFIPKGVRGNIPVTLTFDKFGDYKAVYEYKNKTLVSTPSVDSIDVSNYLKNI